MGCRNDLSVSSLPTLERVRLSTDVDFSKERLDLVSGFAAGVEEGEREGVTARFCAEFACVPEALHASGGETFRNSECEGFVTERVCAGNRACRFRCGRVWPPQRGKEGAHRGAFPAPLDSEVNERGGGKCPDGVCRLHGDVETVSKGFVRLEE